MPQIRSSGGLAISGSVSVKSKVGFTTFTQTIGTTETSIVIPSGAVSFRLKAGNSAILTYSHISTGTSAASTSDEIPKYNTWTEESLNLTSDLTIYIKSDTSTTPVQVTYWT